MEFNKFNQIISDLADKNTRSKLATSEQTFLDIYFTGRDILKHDKNLGRVLKN